MKTRAMLLGLAAVVGLFTLRGCGGDGAAIERMAEVEHEQWMAWSKKVAPEVSPERRARWEKSWVPYRDLPEAEKEKDREWARKALAAARGR